MLRGRESVHKTILVSREVIGYSPRVLTPQGGLWQVPVGADPVATTGWSPSGLVYTHACNAS